MRKEKDNRNNAVRTQGTDTRRDQATGEGATEVCGGNQAKVYYRQVPDNGGLRLLTDAEVMVLGERGEWVKTEVVAFWDTGTTWTTISKRLADRLGARLTESKGVSGIGSWQESWKTVVNLRLGDIILPFEPVEVVDYRGSMRPDLVIGMTTIQQGTLTIGIVDGEMTLRFTL